GRELAPFLLTLGLFALTFAGLCISMFPYVVPRALTVHDAAAPDASLGFMLVGAVVLVPVILAYTGWAYWVFRGKVGDEGYRCCPARTARARPGRCGSGCCGSRRCGWAGWPRWAWWPGRCGCGSAEGRAG